ncbi:MAG TPA: hypothetical protein EYP14_07960 [Planctomycetaceae bacterium]|nr:hypothetical protein [Planctomycetaceae bacterium]
MTTTTEELLLAATDVQIQAAGKTPTVSIVAYSGVLMTVPGWGPLVIDLAGVDVSASQISILADHDSTLGGVVGFGRRTGQERVSVSSIGRRRSGPIKASPRRRTCGSEWTGHPGDRRRIHTGAFVRPQGSQHCGDRCRCRNVGGHRRFKGTGGFHDDHRKDH